MLALLFRIGIALSVILFFQACVPSSEPLPDHSNIQNEFLLKDSFDGSLNAWVDFRDSTDNVSAVALNHKAGILAYGGDTSNVTLLDFRSGALLKQLKTENRWINSVLFSENSELLAVAGDTQNIEVFDVASGTRLFKLSGHRSGVKSIAFYQRDSRLVTGSLDKTVKVWDLENGLPIRTLRGHTDSVNAVAVTADGKLIASGSSDGSVRIWDADDGTVLRTLRDHKWHVLSLGFSEDSKTLASGGGDNSVFIYDSSSGERLRVLNRYTAALNSVVFAGDLLVTGSDNGHYHIWSYKDAELIREEAISGINKISGIVYDANAKIMVLGTNKGIRYTASLRLHKNKAPFETIRLQVSKHLEEDMKVEKRAFVPQPVLPGFTPIRQDSFETRAMFLQRVEKLKVERSDTLKDIVSSYEEAVKQRNSELLQLKNRYRTLRATLDERQKSYIAEEFQRVMNAPIVLPLYQDDKPAYDAENALLEIRLNMRGADYATQLQLHVAAGKAARELFKAVKENDVKSRAYYRFLDENTVELDRVEVLFNSKIYLGYEKEKRSLNVADPIKAVLEKNQINAPDEFFLLQDTKLRDREFERFLNSL